MMEKLCTHPNVGAALLVSLGCEGFDKRRLARTIEASGRPVQTTGIQDAGGTRRTIAAGRDWIERTLPDIARQQPVPMGIDELTVGTICGGSDATSGLTANPAMGVAFDLSDRRRREDDLRGNRRVDRHGAPHGRAGRESRPG